MLLQPSPGCIVTEGFKDGGWEKKSCLSVLFVVLNDTEGRAADSANALQRCLYQNNSIWGHWSPLHNEKKSHSITLEVIITTK